MPGAILGQFYLLLCNLKVLARERKKESEKDRGKWKEGKEKEGESPTERESGKEKREACFFFNVFAFTTPKFLLIPSVHNRAIDGEKKHFHMCKLASSLP